MTIAQLKHPGVRLVRAAELVPGMIIALRFGRSWIPWEVRSLPVGCSDEPSLDDQWLSPMFAGYALSESELHGKADHLWVRLERFPRGIERLRGFPQAVGVPVLPRHFGICRCGAIAPCVDEQTERDLTRAEREIRIADQAAGGGHVAAD